MHIRIILFLLLFAGWRAYSLPPNWASRGPGGGGALYAPSICPFNAQELFMGCDMGEVFHSTNSGVSWETVDFQQLAGGRNSDVQFGATSNLCFTLNYPNGRFHPKRSDDGGRTWRNMSGWNTNNAAFAVYPDWFNTNKLIVNGQTNLAFSSDGGASFATRFVFTNGQAIAGQLRGLRLCGAFWDGTNIFLGSNAGLLVSTNGGASFTNAPVGGLATSEVIFSFCGAKQGATTRFYAVTVSPQTAYLNNQMQTSYGGYRGVYAMNWGDANWTTVTNTLGAGGEKYLLVAAPTGDVNTAYLTGANSTFYPFARILKTTDGGATWSNTFGIVSNANIVTGWGGARTNTPVVSNVNISEPNGLCVARGDASRVVFNDTGFAHLSTNGGVTWQQIYCDTASQHPTNFIINNSYAYRGNGCEPTVGVWMHWVDTTNMLIGHSDIRMTRSHDAGRTWGFDLVAFTNVDDECYHITKHPQTNLLFAALSHVISPYVILGLDDTLSTDGPQIYGHEAFSTNNGATWNLLKTFTPNASPPMWEELDANDPNTLYVSVMNTTNGGVYFTTNVLVGPGATWTNMPLPWRTNGPLVVRANGRTHNLRSLKDGTLLVSFSCLVRNSNSLFEASSGCWITTNRGATWEDRSHTNMYWWTQDVVIDPWDAGQSNWYAGVWLATSTNVIGANATPGLYRTADRGRSWTRIFTNDDVKSVTFSPVNSNELWVASRFTGLWHSDDIRSATPAFHVDTNYPFRQPMRVFYHPSNSNEVWVLSNGNGSRVGWYSNWNLTVQSTGSGTNIGATIIYDGMPAALTFSAAPFFHIASLQTNGAELTLTNSSSCTITWPSVSADAQIDVAYAPNLAALGTPHAWLAAHGLATNDAAELSDVDADGLAAWHEYICDSDPTNSASHGPQIAFPAPASLVISATSTSRLYDLFYAASLMSNDWNVWSSNLPSVGPSLTVVITDDVPSRVYRAGVHLP